MSPRFRRLLGLAALVLLAYAPIARAAETVDLELVMLADASGSIDEAELRFQREGYATAITHPSVLSAILSGGYRRIAVTYVEWATADSQDIVVPWHIVSDAASARTFAAALIDPAKPRKTYGGNAIGSALALATALIEKNDIAGTRKVIDLSADSANSWSGIPIATARAAAIAAGMTINGLAILCRDANCGGRPIGYDLEAAFEKTIIGGPGAFVVTAEDRQSFEQAVRRKLILEISDRGPAPSRHAHALADDRRHTDIRND
jgi:hypothetical protein